MTPEAIVRDICAEFNGVVPKSSWGETSLFYNPGNLLPNGVYFCTIKEKDGENDKASQLSREGIFRLAIGLPKKTYVSLFSAKPPRPKKGGIVSTGHDFTRLNELMPHPIYAWMGWVQVLSPTTETFTQILPLIQEAHTAAVEKFKKKTAVKKDLSI
ncbi:MAG: DUF6194 family protein [Cyanobacteria bacterium J06598_1]